VQPLIAEIEALVEQNRATVERARGHIGNLAHALRTNLAVLRNALDRPGGADLVLARAEVVAAERLVGHHLARARAGVLTGATARDVPALGVAEELAAALRRLFAAQAIAIDVAGDAAVTVRCDRHDLSEMLGNLVENACKWAASRVVVAVAGGPGMVRLTVEDDGPGLAAEQRTRALGRGVRLDEAAPGSGFGLAIVAELAALYGGALALEDAAPHGLRAVLTLPAGVAAA
jgi:signal transduction histidine kinase